MFNNIRKARKSDDLFSGVKRAKSNGLANAIATQFNASNRTRLGANTIHGLSDHYGNVRKLVAVAKTDGISRSLIRFLNFNKTLTNAGATGVPAVESLDLVTADRHDYRTTRLIASLESDILANEEETVADALNEVAEDTAESVDAAGDTAEKLEDAIDDVKEEVADVVISDVVTSTVTVKAINADARRRTIEALTGVVSNLCAPDLTDLSDEKLDLLRKTINDIVEAIGPFTGLVYVDGVVSVDPSAVESQYIANDGTLDDLGYTQDVVDHLLGEAKNLVTAIKELSDKSGEIKEGIATGTASGTESFTFDVDEFDEDNFEVADGTNEGDEETTTPDEDDVFGEDPLIEDVPEEIPSDDDVDTFGVEDTEGEEIAELVETPAYSSASVLSANFATLITCSLDASVLAVNELLQVADAITGSTDV